MSTAGTNLIQQARRATDALLSGLQIPVGEATELPPAEAALQWRLAVALQGRNPARDFENTRPLWEDA